MGEPARKLYTDPTEDRILPWNGRSYFTLNRISDGKMTQKAYNLNQIEFVLSHISSERDTYMAQGFFSKPSRRALFVETLTHAYVDIDCYKIAYFAEWMTLDQKAHAILAYCDDNLIPQPSAIISSGRGIYLKWYWDRPIPREAVGRAVAINKHLVSLFSPMGADPACVDVSRILRVVGTLNTKNNQHVALLHQSEVDGRARTYCFDDFADEVLPYRLEQIREWRQAQKERYEAKGQTILLARERARAETSHRKGFNKVDWCWKVVEDLRTLADIRYGGMVPYCDQSGDMAGPDMFAHIGASMLGHVVSPAQLWPEIQTWASLILPASYVNNRQNLLAHSSTLLKKVREQARLSEAEKRENEKAGNSRKGAYRYRTETIINRLAITTDEMKKLSCLIDKNEKRHRDRIKTLASRREAGAMERVQWLAEHDTNRTKPWEKLGISRATYYRRMKTCSS